MFEIASGVVAKIRCSAQRTASGIPQSPQNIVSVNGVKTIRIFTMRLEQRYEITLSERKYEVCRFVIGFPGVWKDDVYLVMSEFASEFLQ